MKSILLALISFVICLALELFIIAQKDIFIAIGLIIYGVSMFSLSLRLWEVHRHAKNIGSDE